MRALILLQGAPGCGKSTFVHKHGLESYTLSTDAMRHLISPLAHCIRDRYIEPAFDNTPATSQAAFEIVESAVRARMRRDELIIIDSTAGKRQSNKRFLTAAKECLYPVYYCNMQTDISLEEVLKRNANRPVHEQVPEQDVRRIYENVERYQLTEDERYITPDELLALRNVPEIDASSYDELCFIGDAHGCWSKLKDRGIPAEIENDHPTKHILYVFCGDMLDRGPLNEAHNVFDFVCDHIDDENIIFLMGNHERWWRKFGLHPSSRGKFPRSAIASEADILESSKYFENLPHNERPEALHKLINEVVPKFRAFAGIRFKNTLYFVSHAGLHPLTVRNSLAGSLDALRFSLGFEPESTFTYGEGRDPYRSDYELDIDELINTIESERASEIRHDVLPRIIQVHGHRNNFEHEALDFEYSVNLDYHPDATENGIGVLYVG